MSSSFINEVIDLLNGERAQVGLDPLTKDPLLSQAAQLHSESMADNDFFSHTGADGSTFSEHIQDTGYQYSMAGENIAAGYSTPEDVVEAWMNSSGHRANILNQNFKEVGVGYNFLANDTGAVNYFHYWTVDFATSST